MARSLPFEVAPAPTFQEIGNDENGRLRFLKRRAISIPERLAVREVDHNDELFEAMGLLADQVHQEALKLKADGESTPYALVCSESRAQAYAAIHRAIDAFDRGGMPRGADVETELALRHPDAVQALRDQKERDSNAVIVRKATVMIQRRLKGCEYWTDADTIDLDSEALIVEIAMFYEQEANGLNDTQALQDTHRQLMELEEALGKLQQEPGGRPPSLTGDLSSGAAAPDSQAPESSSPTASDPSPSATSSTPPTRRRKQS